MGKKLGLFSAVSTGIGMIIATSCFISLASGAGAVGTPFIISIVGVFLLNMMSIASVAELNAIMPNLTGGLAQYMLAGLGPLVTIVTMTGGYIISNIFAAPAEGAMFANVMCEFVGHDIPPAVFSVSLTIILIIINLRGVNMSAALQTVIASFMVVSLIILGVMGAFGLAPGAEVEQPAALSTDLGDIMPLTATAFWLFIGAEFIVPLGKDMKKPKRNVPLAMFLSFTIMCVIQVLMVLGFKNYTPWAELGAANSPHILYAENMLGSIGRYWIIIVAIFAAVSTQNSIIGCVSEICCGMAKSQLLPAVFQKKNKYGAPYVVILIMGGITILIEATGLSDNGAVQFLILTSSLFWMLTYMVYHINVIALRRKMKKVPRSFKTPFFPIFQIIGIAGTAYMMYNISTDPQERIMIFILSIVLFLFLVVYAVYWVKYKLKMPLLKSVGVRQVMSMEDPLYYYVRHREEEDKKYFKKLERQNKKNSKKSKSVKDTALNSSSASDTDVGQNSEESPPTYNGS